MRVFRQSTEVGIEYAEANAGDLLRAREPDERAGKQ